jgi:hypothetical protein
MTLENRKILNAFTLGGLLFGTLPDNLKHGSSLSISITSILILGLAFMLFTKKI